MAARLEQLHSPGGIERESSDSGFAAADDRSLRMCGVFTIAGGRPADALQELEAVGAKLHNDSLTIAADDRKMVLTGGRRKVHERAGAW